MENNLDHYFKGILESNVVNQIEKFIHFVKNSNKENPSLYMESDDVLKLNEVSNNLLISLQSLNLATHLTQRPLSLFLANYLIIPSTDCIIVNATNESVVNLSDWDKLKKCLKQSKTIIIYLTTKEYGSSLRKKYNDDFYNVFDHIIELNPYSIEEIVSGSHYALEQSGLDYDKENFYPAFDEWIRTVYLRADRQGEAFIQGIINRLIKQSWKLDQNGYVTRHTIPTYWHSEYETIVHKEIEEHFANYISIKNILSLVQNNKGQNNPRNKYNLLLQCNQFDIVKQFASYYGRLLNTKENNIIHSKIVEVSNISEFFEDNNYDNKHGIILIKGLDDLNYQNPESKSIMDNLIQLLSNNTLDLVWILHTQKGKDSIDTSLLNHFSFYKFEQNIENNKYKNVKEKEEQLCELVKNTETDSSELNVLLLAMSTLPRFQVSVSEYESKENPTIKGYYVSQLEPVPKLLIEKLYNEGKQRLDSIYVLNTSETLGKKPETQNITDYSDEEEVSSAFDYFKERCSKFIDPKKIISIFIKENENGQPNVSQALYRFTNRIGNLSKNKKVNLYVDIHGGPRDNFTIFDAVLMLIKNNMPNVELKDIYTVNTANRNKCIIESAKDTFSIFDFVGGMHEFLSFGRSKKLEQYIERNELTTKNNESELVAAINEFSDCISLNKAEYFSNTLNNLSDKFSEIDKHKDSGYFGTVKQLIENNYIVNINGKEYKLLSKNENYLPAHLKWCLDKDLIQQVLTLIESKMASTLAKYKILTYEDNIKKLKNDIDDWVSLTLFFSGTKFTFYDSNNETITENESIAYFDNYSNFFCNINLKNKYIKKEILDNIDKKKNKDIDDNYYYKKISKNNPYTYKNKKEEKNKNSYNYFEKAEIPLNKKLHNQSSFKKTFYELLFIHKGLKMFRNSVSHANGKQAEKITKEELKLWIGLYIELLDQLIQDSKKFNLKSANNNKNTNKNSNKKTQNHNRKVKSI